MILQRDHHVVGIPPQFSNLPVSHLHQVVLVPSLDSIECRFVAVSSVTVLSIILLSVSMRYIHVFVAILDLVFFHETPVLFVFHSSILNHRLTCRILRSIATCSSFSCSVTKFQSVVHLFIAVATNICCQSVMIPECAIAEYYILDSVLVNGTVLCDSFININGPNLGDADLLYDWVFITSVAIFVNSR